MPTGLNEKVIDGTATFEDFVWKCAAQFFYDGHIDEPCPTDKRPLVRHYEDELASYRSATPEQLGAMFREERQKIEKHNAEVLRVTAEKRERVEAMLRKAQDWPLPSTEHEALKLLMVDQLKDALFELSEPYLMQGPTDSEVWREAKILQLEELVAYHRREHDRDLERYKSRRTWVESLEAAVPRPGPEER